MSKIKIIEPPKPLTSEEKTRLDQIMSEAKKAHYAAYIMAFTSLVLTTLDNNPFITIPIFELAIPKPQASIWLYFGVILSLGLSKNLLFMNLKWIKLDDRRISYPWIVFSSGNQGQRNFIFYFWYILPILLCSISTYLSLGYQEIYQIFILLFSGFMVDIYISLLPTSILMDKHISKTSFCNLPLIDKYKAISSGIGGSLLMLIIVLFLISLMPGWENIEKISIYCLLGFTIYATIDFFVSLIFIPVFLFMKKKKINKS